MEWIFVIRLILSLWIKDAFLICVLIVTGIFINIFLIQNIIIVMVLLYDIWRHFPQHLCYCIQKIYLLGAHYSPANTVIIRNLVYSNKYLNSTYDIFPCDNAKAVIFYIHGGGYCFDDKKYREKFLSQYVENGFEVISINYGLVPFQYYEDTIFQIKSAFEFIYDKYIREHKKLIIAGDSVGAQLGAQLIRSTNIQPNAFISIGGLLDMRLGDKTDFWATNLLMNIMMRSYFQSNDFKQNANFMIADNIVHIDSNFPPTFISDGNIGTFTKQAIRFYGKLKELNIASELVLYDKSKVKLYHVFELKIDNVFASQVFQRQINFINQILNK